MENKLILGNRSNLIIMLFFVVTYFMVVFLNDGFMASDDYWVGITRYTPAQTSDLYHLVHEDDVKSPLQLSPFYFGTQAAYKLGFSHPYHQYRFMLAILSLINILLLVWALRKYSKLDSLTQNDFFPLLFLSSFYFVMPFSLTRPMFETLAAPWLLLSAVFAKSYDHKGKLSDLLWATAFVSIAFCLRVQVGICALAVALIPLIHRRWRDFIYCALLGGLFFVLSGIPDLILRGHFHHSLYQLVTYNFAYGGIYGQQPWYFYFAMLFVLLLGPFFIMRYPRGFWLEQWQKNRALLLFVIFFIGVHNIFPQKFERFLISIFGILLLLIWPLVLQIWSTRSRRPIRFYLLLVINFVFWVPASFTRPQNAILEMALAIDAHPEVKRIYRYEGRPEWIPEVFIGNASRPEQIDVKAEEIAQINLQCGSDWIVVPRYLESEYLQKMPLTRVEFFSSNWIEELSFKLNPKNNSRRASLVALTCRK